MRAISAHETEARDVLAAVTPGGGKSLLPVIAASRLIGAGIADRVVWIVPRETLKHQAEEAFADASWRNTLGHALSVRAADNEPDPSRGLAGYVTTYQAVAAAPDLHLAEFQRTCPGTSQGWRHEEAEDPRVDEGINHRAREPALALGLVDMLSNQGREVVHGSKCRVGHRGASFSDVCNF